MEPRTEGDENTATKGGSPDPRIGPTPSDPIAPKTTSQIRTRKDPRIHANGIPVLHKPDTSLAQTGHQTCATGNCEGSDLGDQAGRTAWKSGEGESE